jgi:molybdate-binding protein/DNA-binding XRE family transcriptional regulator
MASTSIFVSHVRAFREKRGWSQAELAARTGVSRAGISAIETGRLVPSTAAALAVGRAFDCSVESLFTIKGRGGDERPRWAWTSRQVPVRVWAAEVGGRTLLYPVESGELGCLPHDGIWDGHHLDLDPSAAGSRTLVIATCDPAVGLLASALASAENIRLVAVQRSSHAALQLLAEGVVHGAGMHFADDRHRADNRVAASETVHAPIRMIRVAEWEEGVALRPGSSCRNVRQAVRSVQRWVGRDLGSGARQCQDTILAGRSAPRHTARSHRAVAEAIRSGWADAGVCVRLVSSQAGLGFIAVRREPYDLCFPAEFAADARYAALLRVLRSLRFRRLLADLPGYGTAETGEEVLRSPA